MRATIRQVAERAGVSRTTVSNVLLGRTGSVTAETREVVLRAVQEMEYVPVRPALQNRHVPTHTIALSLGDAHKVDWGINADTYKGMCEGALVHGYDLMTLLRPDPDWALDRREVQFLDRRSDGFIFASPFWQESREIFEALARAEIPTVVCYRRDVPEEVAWIDPDNKAVIYGALSYLVERGHTRIAHLTEKPPHLFDVTERIRFFDQAMDEFGLSHSKVGTFDASYHRLEGVAQEMIARGATALICFSDAMAAQLWETMEAQGLRVPDDLSLIGVEGQWRPLHEGLTTLAYSYVDVGRLAVDALVAQIKGAPASACCHEIPVELRERHSVAPPRQY